jgi:hypothetical protein
LANDVSDDESHAPLGRRDFFDCTLAAVGVGLVTTTTAPACAASTLPAVTTTKATCDANVSVWQQGNRLLYLLGTAHISQISAELAGQLVRDTHPGAVFVELDLRRVGGGTAEQNGIVSSQVNVTPGTPTSKVIIPNVVPFSERGLTVATSTLEGTALTTSTAAAASSSSSRQAQQPSWFTRTLTDVGAALVGKAIRGLYANLGDAGFSPGDEFVTAIHQGQALQR